MTVSVTVTVTVTMAVTDDDDDDDDGGGGAGGGVDDDVGGSGCLVICQMVGTTMSKSVKEAIGHWVKEWTCQCLATSDSK